MVLSVACAAVPGSREPPVRAPRGWPRGVPAWAPAPAAAPGDIPAPGAEAVAQGEHALVSTVTGQRANSRFAAASSSAFNGKTAASANT